MKRSKKPLAKVDSSTHEDDLPMSGPGREDLSQLYSWTFDIAWQAQEDFDKNGGKTRGPFWRWDSAQKLKELKKMYRAGDRGVIIEAFYNCSIDSLPIPDWLACALIGAYYKVTGYKVKSWDEVFDKPYPKHIKIEAHRDAKINRVKVWLCVRGIRNQNPDRPIDKGLFEEVGKGLCISGSKAEKLYYEQQNKYQSFLKNSSK